MDYQALITQLEDPAALPMLAGSTGRVFALGEDTTAIAGGERAPEPLALHVNVGDCVTVELTNALPRGPVSFHVDMLAFDPLASGVPAGRNATSPVAAGQTRAFTFYAHPAIGETTALVRDFADVTSNPRLGLYGAIIVGPIGATYTDPETGADSSAGSSWRVDVHPPNGPAYRDFALFFQDEDAAIGTHRMPYTRDVDGVVGLNYRIEPLGERPAGIGAFDLAAHPPRTPELVALVGDPVRIHVIAPYSEQAQVFAIEGHRWPQERGTPRTNLLSAVQVGGLEAITLELDGGAGGPAALAGDYTYGDARTAYRDAGLWGAFRVYACVPAGVRLASLDGRGAACAASGGPAGLPPTLVVPYAVLLGAAVMLGIGVRRRRNRGRQAGAA